LKAGFKAASLSQTNHFQGSFSGGDITYCASQETPQIETPGHYLLGEDSKSKRQQKALRPKEAFRKYEGKLAKAILKFEEAHIKTVI